MTRRTALVALLAGTLLAPLNSSMVAVAVAPIQQHFTLSLATTTWMVTVFYLTASVCQPLLGRVADQIGPRRLFTAGLLVATAASAMAALAPSFAVLVVCRGLQAVGISAAFPCAMVVLRRDGGAAAGRLSMIATVNTTAGAVGPVLGGLLTSWGGWQSIFWVNLPILATALVLAWRALGPDDRRPGSVLRCLDPIGVALFAAAAIGLLDVVLTGFSLLGALVLGLGAGGFLWWERRAAEPFVDLRALGGVRSVLGIFVLFNLVYYGAFYGLPPWLQSTLGYDAAAAGLLIMPIAVTSVVATVLGSPIMRRLGVGRTLVAAGVVLLAGVALIAVFGPDTPAWLVVADGVVLGVPYGLGNLGLQRLMYERAPAEMSGVVGGLFQSARYAGAILAVGLAGATAPPEPCAPPDIRVLAIAMSAVAVAVVGLLIRDLRHPGRALSRETVGAGRQS
ncbi:MFS transporter [Amycolatopsis jejuensis]|uniref:MFS transporter n=1 Tax=Amycolatopsis jejuensis TaxID=330084 RepID=UPI00068B2625|nr:MFS transporter [Amycolatopsis jejuensis]